MTYVVIADQISIRDPEDGATRREEQHHLYLSRGEALPSDVSPKEIERLLKMDAIADDAEGEGASAASGVPRARSLRRPTGAIPLGPTESEQIRAIQSAAQFPGGVAQGQAVNELLSLSMDTLIVMAKAYGVPVDDSSTKQSLAESLANGGKDAPGAADLDEIADARAAQNEAVGAARENGNQTVGPTKAKSSKATKPADEPEPEPEPQSGTEPSAPQG